MGDRVRYGVVGASLTHEGLGDRSSVLSGRIELLKFPALSL